MLTIPQRKRLGTVAQIKRTTPRDSARGQTAPEAVPGPRDFPRGRELFEDHAPIGSFQQHGDRSMQMLVGVCLLTIILFIVLPLVAYFR